MIDNSELREACFACTTPYQIIGAISIVGAKSLLADLIVFGMFDDYVSVSENIRKSGIFRNVYAVPSDKFKSPGRNGAAIQMLNSRNVIGSFLPDTVIYDQYYSSSRAHIKNILLHELLRRNKNLQIVVYDDGMGTYSSDSHVLNTTKIRHYAERFLRWELYTSDRVSFMVYEPSLFDRPKGYDSCDVIQMPKPELQGDVSKRILDAFGINENDSIKEKVIIFDPLRGADKERDEKLTAIDICYKMVVKHFGYENVVVKTHPRSSVSPNVDAKFYRRSGIPMEVLYAGMKDLNERILITYASTAVYTPKILFGSEPHIINLFRIVDNADGSFSEWEVQHQKFTGTYRDKARIVAPYTLSEFNEYLERIAKQ